MVSNDFVGNTLNNVVWGDPTPHKFHHSDGLVPIYHDTMMEAYRVRFSCIYFFYVVWFASGFRGALYD